MVTPYMIGRITINFHVHVHDFTMSCTKIFCLRSNFSLTHWHSKPLAVAKCNVSTDVPRGRQHGQGKEVRCHGYQHLG